MQYIRAKLKLLKSYLPLSLPQNGLELNGIIAEILQRANVPDNDSFRQAIAGEFMQPENLSKKRSIQHYVQLLRQRVTSQLAYVIIDDIRNRAKAANEQSVQSPQI